MYDNVRYVYRKDVQGNIIAILDSTGNVVVEYKYDAWGNHAVLDSNGNDVISGIGVLNPFRYRGYYYDTETRLYYLQTRYYDPEVGRFINMDSIDYAIPYIINGMNLYAYAINNPVYYMDQDGHFIISIGAVIAGAIAAAFGVGLVYNEAKNHTIGNALVDIGYAISDAVQSTQTPDIPNASVGNDNVSLSISSELIAGILSAEVLYAKNKNSYKPRRRGVRVKGKSKKDAEEKARKRGGGKPPVHHRGTYNPELGKWIGPHYHPGVPKGHPYHHDHYFYSLFLILLFSNDIDE